MPTTIKLKNSVTTTNAPSSLAQGEVAINITDKKVWVGNAATTPIQLVGDGGSASFTSIAFGAGTVTNPSITFTGDTNTGIFSPAADTIAFTEGGVEAMRIDSSGNVGIGTSSPTQKLVVNGNQAILGGNYLTLLESTNNNQYQLKNDTNNLTFVYNSTERMRITSAGLVGVGITSPTYNLQAVGRIAASNTSGEASVHVVNSTSDVYMYNSFAGNSFGIFDGTASRQLLAYERANNNWLFFTNAAERMRIDSSGKVAINTSTYATNGGYLTIDTLAQTGIDIYRSDSTAQYNGVRFRNTTNTTTYGSLGWDSGGLRLDGDAGTMYFSTSGTERMRINSAGAVFIATTTQFNSSLLTVAGRINADRYFSGPNGTGSWNHGAETTTGTPSFIVYNSNGTGVFLAYGGTSWSANSDERTKTPIKPFENALEKVCSLRAGTGRYLKDDESVSRSFLIAQDVQKVLPEAVNVQNDEMRTLGLAYTDTIPLLVAAIKELNAKVAELEAKLK